MRFSTVTFHESTMVLGSNTWKLVASDNSAAPVAELKACEYGVLVVTHAGKTQLVPWHLVGNADLLPEPAAKGGKAA